MPSDEFRRIPHHHPSHPVCSPAEPEQASNGLADRLRRLRARKNHSCDPLAPSLRLAETSLPSTRREVAPEQAITAGHGATPGSTVGSHEAVGQPAGSASGIDIVEQTLISAEDVAAIVPPRRRGRKMHRSTFHRWCTKGQNGVVLPSVWIGSQRYTSVEALQAFIERGTELRDSHLLQVPSRDPGGHAPSSARETRRQRRVEEALKKFGL